MILTREIDAVIEAAGLSVRDTGSGYILSAKGDADTLFANAPLRILSLYTAAAALGADVNLSTLAAANANSKSIGTLPPEKVYTAIDAIIMSEHPEPIAALVNSGGLEAFGIKSVGCIHTLSSVPQLPTARWWAFLHIAKANIQNTLKKLCAPKKLEYTVNVYNKMWLSKPPQTVNELKIILSQLPEFRADIAINVFFVFDERWQKVNGIYKKLIVSREPYLMRHLAITAPELMQYHIPSRKIPRVMAQLLTAVCKTPAVNTYPALCELAKVLSRSM